MRLARTATAIVMGVDAHIIEVEAHLADGLPAVSITGLADTGVKESRERVRAAIVCTGVPWPQRRITVGLSPAWLPKFGSGLDLFLHFGNERAEIAATHIDRDDRAPLAVFAADLVRPGGLDDRRHFRQRHRLQHARTVFRQRNRQAFEAARRAIIRCGSRGFPLPAEKYDQWREVEMVFNPEGMRMK